MCVDGSFGNANLHKLLCINSNLNAYVSVNFSLILLSEHLVETSQVV